MFYKEIVLLINKNTYFILRENNVKNLNVELWVFQKR
jgi:hypothetical protein